MTRGVVIGPMAAAWHPLSGDASRDCKRHECAVQLELMTGISDFSFGAVKCIRLKNVSAGGNRTEVLWDFYQRTLPPELFVGRSTRGDEYIGCGQADKG